MYDHPETGQAIFQLGGLNDLREIVSGKLGNIKLDENSAIWDNDIQQWIPHLNYFIYNKKDDEMDVEVLQKMDKEEISYIMSEIQKACSEEGNNYVHVWSKGDIVLTDNLALAHLAGQAGNQEGAKNGVRILHMATILGSYPI